jgi:hypothetical protein
MVRCIGEKIKRWEVKKDFVIGRKKQVERVFTGLDKCWPLCLEEHQNNVRNFGLRHKDALFVRHKHKLFSATWEINVLLIYYLYIVFIYLFIYLFI